MNSNGAAREPKDAKVLTIYESKKFEIHPEFMQKYGTGIIKAMWLLELADVLKGTVLEMGIPLGQPDTEEDEPEVEKKRVTKPKPNRSK